MASHMADCKASSSVTFAHFVFRSGPSTASSLSMPAPGVHICVESDPPGRHWISYYWTTVICTETILLTLSLYKGWQNRRTGYGGSVMRVLTRDSVLYFIA